MLSELTIGRGAQANAIDSYGKLGHPGYKWVGWFGVIVAFIITSYYCHVGGWVLRYVASYATEATKVYADPLGYFYALLGYNAVTGETWFPLTAVIFAGIFMGITCFIIVKGVESGIERFNKIGMPALFCLLVFIIAYIACQPGAAEGYKFMFSPDFSVFSDPNVGFGRVLKNAAGQMFFSLSIGLGVMITYGSYLGKQEHLQRNAFIVCGADTLIALMAGMAVMPACAAFGVEYGAGPGLLFASMQTVFSHMGSVGNLIGFLFYLLVLIAALTSSISMLELCTAYAVDKQIDKGLTPKRAKHTSEVAALVFIAGSLVALDGLGAGVAGGAAVETPATLLGLSVRGWNDCWLDLYDMVAEGILMPLGALVMTILIGLSLIHI